MRGTVSVCSSCGADIEQGARFCSRCGQRIITQSTPQPPDRPGRYDPVLSGLPEATKAQSSRTRLESGRKVPPPPVVAPPLPPSHSALNEPAPETAERKPIVHAGSGLSLGEIAGRTAFIVLGWAAGWGVGRVLAIEIDVLMTGRHYQPVYGLASFHFSVAIEHAFAGAVGGALAGIPLLLLERGRRIAGVLPFLLTFLVWIAVQISALQADLHWQFWPHELIAFYAVVGAIVGMVVSSIVTRPITLKSALYAPLHATAWALGAAVGAYMLSTIIW